MEKDWTNVIFLVVGAVLGFSGAIGIESIKRCWEKKDQKQKTKKMLFTLEKEIEEGIERCKGLIGCSKSKKISFSRIYIALWDSIKIELAKTLEDLDILILLHKIYYRFDLINFNMQRDRFGVGAAFARKYIEEIEKNFNLFKKYLERR